ncbi:MAG: hypothetical protein AAF639_27875 [Chloroflexota bacterium]
MQKKQTMRALSLFIIAALLVVSGCAPRAGAGEVAELGGIVVDMPALVIEYDADGNPSIANMPLAQVADMVQPGAAEGLAMDPAMIQAMTDNNIQHIQISLRVDGLDLIVNGRSMPSIGWDGESLASTGELAGAMGVEVAGLDKLLPLIRHLGIGAIVSFPMAEGAEAIPTYIEDESESAMAARETQESFLASVGTPPRINLPIFYDLDGGVTIADMTDAEWTNLTGVPWDSLRMPPEMIQSMADNGIEQLTISTGQPGIMIHINDMALPHISWDDGKLQHVLDMADSLGLWDTLADSGMNAGEIIAMVEGLLPVIQTAEVNVNVFFPPSGTLAVAN